MNNYKNVVKTAALLAAMATQTAFAAGVKSDINIEDVNVEINGDITATSEVSGAGLSKAGAGGIVTQTDAVNSRIEIENVDIEINGDIKATSSVSGSGASYAGAGGIVTQ